MVALLIGGGIWCSATVRVSGQARTVVALGERLAHASYNEGGVREIVRPDSLDLARGIAAVRLRPAADEPLGRLVRLFLAGEELDLGSASEALSPLTPAELEAAGLVERAPGGVRATVRLTPFRGLVIASDRCSPGRLPEDHVVDPGPATETLAKLTVRSRVANGLDLCAGSGAQTLLAAGHCERVIGSDINGRALRLAAVSAALSGIENVEWRHGDLFAPVSGEQFDVVVANPPFVIGPGRELTFRDSGRPGDELSREVLVGCAAHLADQGFGHMLCSWVRAPGDHWSKAPQRWLQGTGCDGVIVKLDIETAVSYAVRWTSLPGATATEAVERAEAWVDYYRQIGIEEIVTGAIVIRRRAGANWVYSDELTSIEWGAGEQLARMFTGHDALDSLANELALLERPLSVAPFVSLVERWHPGETLERARLTIAGGLSLPGRITPPAAAAALHMLDGRRTLREAATAAAVDESDLELALPSLCDLVRRGYLIVG
jgi:methylase of polypeptide subunit release factors